MQIYIYFYVSFSSFLFDNINILKYETNKENIINDENGKQMTSKISKRVRLLKYNEKPIVTETYSNYNAIHLR